jgi:GNAT superfamily N-acetyltransferase
MMIALNQTETYDENTLARMDSLVRNYEKNKAGEIVISEIPLKVVCHDRGYGQKAFYAIRNGTPIAYCVGHFQQRQGRRDRFIITSTFIHPDFQRKGIGLALYRTILSTGVVLISDWDQSDGAVALWEKLLREEPMGDIVRFQNGYFARRKK